MVEGSIILSTIFLYLNHIPDVSTEEVIDMLDEIKPIDPYKSEFKAKIEQLRTAVRTHINQEENDIFPKLRDNFSHQQLLQMATEFKTAKSKLQEQMNRANSETA